MPEQRSRRPSGGRPAAAAAAPTTTRPAARGGGAAAKPSRRAAPPVAAEKADAAVPSKSLAPRRLPSQRRGQETVETVLRAAGHEIEQGGLDRLTTKRIAAAAGLSVGAVYGYFPNKEAIVSALVARWHERVFEAVDGIHPRLGPGLDLLSYLNTQIDRAAQAYEDQPGLGALFSMLDAMPAVAEVTAGHDRRVFESLTSALRYYLPKADRHEVDAAARAIPVVCHELMMLAIEYHGAERARLTTLLRVCVMAMATRLMTA